MGRTARQANQHRPAGVKRFSKKARLAASLAAQARWRGKENSSKKSTTAAQPQAQVMQGARIIPLDKLSDTITELSSHSANCGGTCTVTRENRSGLATTLHLACRNCAEVFTLQSSELIHSENMSRRWGVNVGAVWGQMATGGGAARLNETFAAVEVPALSKTTFVAIEEEIGRAWANLLTQEFLSAGREERQLAEEKGAYHQGVPSVAVTVDGGWSKRSHKHSYNAKSGVGVIIGNATKKLLFVGVRNKYCCVCAVAERKQQPPPDTIATRTGWHPPKKWRQT